MNGFYTGDPCNQDKYRAKAPCREISATKLEAIKHKAIDSRNSTSLHHDKGICNCCSGCQLYKKICLTALLRIRLTIVSFLCGATLDDRS